MTQLRGGGGLQACRLGDHVALSLRASRHKDYVNVALRRSAVVVNRANQMLSIRCGAPRKRPRAYRDFSDQCATIEPKDALDVRRSTGIQCNYVRPGKPQRIADAQPRDQLLPRGATG